MGYGEEGWTYRQYTVRLNYAEDAIIDQARAALNGVNRSELMQEACLAEAIRIGIRWSAARPPPPREPWAYLLKPGERDATRITASLSFSLPIAELVDRAVAHLGVTETAFIVGSTLAHIGRLQSPECFEASSAASAGERRRIRRRLQAIKLPARFQYRGRPPPPDSTDGDK